MRPYGCAQPSVLLNYSTALSTKIKQTLGLNTVSARTIYANATQINDPFAIVATFYTFGVLFPELVIWKIFTSLDMQYI